MLYVNISLKGKKNVVLSGYIHSSSDEMNDMRKKAAILILPGGAYSFLSDREAEPVALAYLAKGFHSFVLKYSVGKEAKNYQPLEDVSDAIEIIRNNSEKWSIVSDKIAICGFSAGGHLAAWSGLQGRIKPDAMILCYPALKIYNHRNDQIARTIGNNIDNDFEKLNMFHYVNENSIPMFCWTTVEDKIVKIDGIVEFVSEYVKYNRPFELHIFQHGEHGMSLANFITANGRKQFCDDHVSKWFDLSVEWLYKIWGKPEQSEKPFSLPERIRLQIKND